MRASLTPPGAAAATSDPILTVNVGSSGIKLATYVGDVRRAFGALARESGGGAWTLTWDGATSVVGATADAMPVDAVIDWLDDRGVIASCAAVGHRIVHGGRSHAAPIWIDSAALVALTALVPLAPDHLPAALAAVRRAMMRAPTVRQAACFDTAFHRTMPETARLFGLSRALAEAGVVRYGFHGLSCEFIVGELLRLAALGARTIIAHLGNGVSLTAVHEGRSIDTTMGLTPTGGVVMATRSGDLDPGVVLYMLRALRMTPETISAEVNDRGGLVGLSGSTGDLRSLLAHRVAHPDAALAIDVFCYQIRRAIGSMTAALGGLDTLVFTGGIGEHAAPVRGEICDGLDCIGVRIDADRNRWNDPVISTAGAPVTVRVIETNEELVIAQHVGALLGSAGTARFSP
jgi:acetate kinase